MSKGPRTKSLKGQYHIEAAALRNAKDRCTRRSHPQYRDYGGRGISVAAEWLGPDGFDNFFSEIGPKPEQTLTLERIDNSKGYEPGNVAWVSRSEQQRSCRPRTTTAGDLGWGVARYHVTDKNGRRRVTRSPLIQLGDEIKTLVSWAKEIGIPAPTIRQRIQRGWPVQQALAPTLFCPRGKPRIN